MGNDFYKIVLDGLGVQVVVKNMEGNIVYKNVQNETIESLDLVSNDIYIDRISKRQYERKITKIDGYTIENYNEVTKYLDKNLSLDLTDENVIVRDEDGNIVFNNLSSDMYSNLKLLEKNIYFDPSSNRYFQKHIKISGNYQADIYHDVTEFIEKADKYTIDALTGLPVRAKINEFISEISKKDSDYIIAMMDIDNFKRVNDTYGHLVGDEVLKRIASVIKDNIRGDDFAGRYGGEEFIMFFKTTDMEAIIRRLHFLRITIKQQVFDSHNSDYEPFNVSVSIGASKFNSRENNIYNSIDEADQALYFVKHNGKNNVSNYAKVLEKSNVK